MAVLISAGAVGLFDSGAEAQTTRGPPNHVWLSAGLGGAGGAGIDGGAVGLGQLSVHRTPHHFALRLGVLVDLSGFPDSGGGSSLADLGVLYGRGTGGDNGYQALAAGLSVVTVSRCPGTTERSCLTLGASVVAETHLTTAAVGFGLQLFGNLNPEVSIIGLAVVLDLGILP